MQKGKKILFVANVHWFFLHFLTPYFKWLREKGHEVHVIANSDEPIPFVSKQLFFSVKRSPFNMGNIKAFFELKKILMENKYNLVHCHTPMGGVLARFAGRKFHKNKSIKVLYTAHGFHFFKGAPWSNWLMYLPVEKFLMNYTDGIVTINNEDFFYAKRLKKSSNQIFKINGIGVNTDKFCAVSQSEKIQIRKKSGYSENDYILVYAAEFINRKNHKFIIDAARILSGKIRNIKIIFAGEGVLQEKSKVYAKKSGVEACMDFIGYRTDLEKWMAMADVCVSSSRQEGLGLSIAEAMTLGLPVVASRIRGHVDLVEDGVNGLLFDVKDTETFVRHIETLYHSPELREKLGSKARETIKPFGIGNVLPEMAEIYSKYLSL